MARIVFSLALLACLGFAILHLVSAEQQNQDVEALSSQAIEASPEEVQVRLLRDADAKKKTNNKGEKSRKVKRRQQRKKRGKKGAKNGKNKNAKKSRRNRRKQKGTKNGKKKNGRKSRKIRRKQKKAMKQKKRRKQKKMRKQRKQEKSRKNQQKQRSFKERQSTNTTNSTCNVEDLCQKIKNYIKYSNQLRKLKRINKTCSTMEKKRDKAGGGEFSASAEANSDSGNDTVNAIAAELKNCTATAKANCETKAVAACTNLTLNTKCEKELAAWIEKFGPAKGSCLQASKDCCKCINNIKPDPSAECLSFDAMDNSSKEKKKKCTHSGTKGSFGYCRKLQMEAAEKGPKAHQAKCKGMMPDGTTRGAGRRMLFRNNLLKKWSNL